MLKKTAIFIIVSLILIQFITVDTTNPKVDEKLALQTDTKVMKLLKQSCYDCHSYETSWPYYSSIAPVSFFISSHVSKGRQAMNFSEWSSIELDIKQKRLKRAIITVNNGMMALPSYVSAHEEAELSRDDKNILISWFKQELAVVEKSLEK